MKRRIYVVLEFKGIEKSFGDLKVLKGVSFRAEGGKAFGILGRNGAGKTTAIRILMGVFPYDGGEVLFDGAPIDHDKIGTGYLPEERGLYPKKLIIDQLVYFAELKGMTARDATRAVDYWLERLDMMQYRNKKLDVLSKGNQQKIQLITALAHDPDIIILDEPFSGLDPVNAMVLKDVVKEQIAKGKIVLFSSHQMNYIEEFCDSIAILNNGKIALCGDISSIKRDYPRDRLVIRSGDCDKIKSELSLPYTDMKNGELLVRLDSPDDKKSVMKQIVEKYDVDEIKVFEPSLTDIFVDVAGDAPTEA